MNVRMIGVAHYEIRFLRQKPPLPEVHTYLLITPPCFYSILNHFPLCNLDTTTLLLI